MNSTAKKSHMPRRQGRIKNKALIREKYKLSSVPRNKSTKNKNGKCLQGRRKKKERRWVVAEEQETDEMEDG